MLIDGEKWACEACVRGHRVSSCHHSDRPLTHINKKGRPVSQCPHCRGLRKSRTTHVKCECGDKKKSLKNDSDSLSVDKGDLKQGPRHHCACTHGQRCTCALKKEHTLDPVPETGLPPPQPAVLSESKKPQLTPTKSESTLSVFRDGHHKPAHKHNDMAHKCGLPYTIPRSHTIHSTSEAHRSVDHLPMGPPGWDDLSHRRPEQPAGGSLRRAKSDQGSPDSAPVTSAENPATSVPPLELPSFFPPASSDQPPLDKPNEGPGAVSTSFGGNSLDPIVTSVPPLDVSLSSFRTTDTSPAAQPAFQDSYPETYFASPDTDLNLGSTAFSAPPVDWSSFPLYSSDVPAATSTQTPSYASFDYNSVPHGLPPPSSSGDLSEVDEFGPIPGLGHSNSDLLELHSVSEGPEDQFRVSSASSFVGLPQTQLLASDNLESIDIDDFLKSANESTAALEHQLQTNVGIDAKPLPDSYAMSQPDQATTTSLPMTTAATDTIWPSSLYDAGSTMDENLFAPSWNQ